MHAHVYILHSPSLEKFYIGSTTLEPKERLSLHLKKKYGISKFTSIASDWSVFFEHTCTNISQARLVEQHIKKMKSRTYIMNLQKYPEMIVKLLNLYHGSFQLLSGHAGQ